ncbi:MAG TPA: TRAP transporter substrate-binding protein [Xanthobacteraceae bacterium]|nr:TRAP transporter substrate-binding protein [Xanthobacteraceae bacterium]
MTFTTIKTVARTASAAGAFALSLTLTLGAANAQDKTYVMKITLPTLNDTPHFFAKSFAAAVERDSGGRIKTEVYPASQLGSIPRQIEGTQFGAIQAATIPPEFFVGVDERFEVMAAPGLVDNMEHGQRLAADPAVLKLMLGLGADKGLHGVGLYLAQPSCLISRTAIRHLADFKGKKIRVFASQFQTVAFDRLGATPVAMTLGDVLPALQQGAIDGAIAGIGVFYNMHFHDAAKYVTETNQPPIFIIVEVSQKWYDSLPKDLRDIIDRDGLAESLAINAPALKMYQEQRKGWVDSGGELISLPADEQATMMQTLSSVGADVSQPKPALHDAYEIAVDAAKRTRQAQTQ